MIKLNNRNTNRDNQVLLANIRPEAGDRLPKGRRRLAAGHRQGGSTAGVPSHVIPHAIVHTVPCRGHVICLPSVQNLALP